jgi:lipopolysaccharide/colanic/teichoic acid biosynthesis glycosyltransferase
MAGRAIQALSRTVLLTKRARERLQYDLFDIKRRSLALNPYILVETFSALLAGSGLWAAPQKAFTLPRHAGIWLPGHSRSIA